MDLRSLPKIVNFICKHSLGSSYYLIKDEELEILSKEVGVSYEKYEYSGDFWQEELLKEIIGKEEFNVLMEKYGLQEKPNISRDKSNVKKEDKLYDNKEGNKDNESKKWVCRYCSEEKKKHTDFTKVMCPECKKPMVPASEFEKEDEIQKKYIEEEDDVHREKRKYESSKRKYKYRGYVYVLVSSMKPEIVKIGMTKRDPEVRAEELNASTGVSMPYIVAYQVEVANPKEVESTVHNRLSGSRVNPDREFFRVETRKAIRTIEEEIEERPNLSKYEAVAQLWDSVGDDGSITISHLEKHEIENLRNLLYHRFGKENVIVRSVRQQDDETLKAVVREREGSKYLRDDGPYDNEYLRDK